MASQRDLISILRQLDLREIKAYANITLARDEQGTICGSPLGILYFLFHSSITPNSLPSLNDTDAQRDLFWTVFEWVETTYGLGIGDFIIFNNTFKGLQYKHPWYELGLELRNKLNPSEVK